MLMVCDVLLLTELCSDTTGCFYYIIKYDKTECIIQSLTRNLSFICSNQYHKHFASCCTLPVNKMNWERSCVNFAVLLLVCWWFAISWFSWNIHLPSILGPLLYKPNLYIVQSLGTPSKKPAQTVGPWDPHSVNTSLMSDHLLSYICLTFFSRTPDILPVRKWEVVAQEAGGVFLKI